MSHKKPLAGEWWEKEGVRLLVVGTKRSGITVGEHECGSIDLFRHQHDWRHLPDCTGWDWQPEAFPQWYAPFYDGKYAYILRTSETKMKRVRIDGSEVETDWFDIDNARTRITQAEAEARIKKPELVNLMNCPDCGEFRGHGHEEICKATPKPEVKPEMSSRELEFLEIVAKQRDTIDKLAKRLEKVEQSNFMHQVIGGAFR